MEVLEAPRDTQIPEDSSSEGQVGSQESAQDNVAVPAATSGCCGEKTCSSRSQESARDASQERKTLEAKRGWKLKKWSYSKGELEVVKNAAQADSPEQESGRAQDDYVPGQEEVAAKEEMIVWRAVCDQGSDFIRQGRYDEAVSALQKALILAQKELVPGHLDLAKILLNLGNVYRVQSKLDLALARYLESLHIKLPVFGEEHQEIAELYDNVASVYKSLGEYEKALECCNKALVIQDKVLDSKDHPDFAHTYSNLGALFMAVEQFDKALAYSQKASSILLQTHSEESERVAEQYCNMGCIYGGLGEHDQALVYLKKASEIFRRILGDEHAVVADVEYNIAQVYQSQAILINQMAKERYNWCAKIYSQVFGPAHEATQGALERGFMIPS